MRADFGEATPGARQTPAHAWFRMHLEAIFDALWSSAESFTCNEADRIHDMYCEVNRPHLAQQFLHAHAKGDEETDDHYEIKEQME